VTTSTVPWKQHSETGNKMNPQSLYVPPRLTFSNSTFCPHIIFGCFVRIWEQTTIISLYSINWLVFITETESVYCAVPKEFLNKICAVSIRTDNLRNNHKEFKNNYVALDCVKWLPHAANKSKTAIPLSPYAVNCFVRNSIG